MNNKKIIPYLMLPLLAAANANAAPTLIAIGEINANYQDYATRTAGALENGIAGNLLGGMGSGLAYAGGNTFLALPDRGPNAAPYDASVDDTASYINRFQTVNLSLAANPAYNAATVGSLPYLMSAYLTDTTLLSSVSPLVYGAATTTLPSGVPALNTAGTYYFTGRSDNFDASKTSTNKFNGRLDPEGIRLANDGKRVYISDEYGPYVLPIQPCHRQIDENLHLA